MNTLYVLLVESDLRQSERISSRLEQASHAVLPAADLSDAAQALRMERFDAVMMSSKLMSEELLEFQLSLERLEAEGKLSKRIPVFCYAPTEAQPPSTAELSRYRVDGFLPGDFDAIGFSQLVGNLAAGLVPAAPKGESVLPVISADDFREQVGFDQDIIVEIVNLFLEDSEQQIQTMKESLRVGDLQTLSRTAHSIKGSLGSLYAKRAAARAQTLEQRAKSESSQEAAEALSALIAAVRELQPELLRLRDVF